MFDIGFWELALIGVVALLVVGPERLPDLARQAGAWIGKAKRFVSSVQADIEREFKADELKRMLNDQQREISQLKGMISDTQAEVHAELSDAENMSESSRQSPIKNDKNASAPPQPVSSERGSEIDPSRPEQATPENGAERR